MEILKIILILSLLTIFEFFVYHLQRHIIYKKELLKLFKVGFYTSLISLFFSELYHSKIYIKKMGFIQITLIFILMAGFKFLGVFALPSEQTLYLKFFQYFFWLYLILVLIEFLGDEKRYLQALIFLITISTLIFSSSFFGKWIDLSLHCLLFLSLIFHLRRLMRLYRNFGWLESFTKVMGVAFIINFSFHHLLRDWPSFIVAYIGISFLISLMPSKDKIHYSREVACLS